MHYLIAYDICSPQRLRRVARFLEKHAIRCQKSVFVFRGPAAELNEVMRELELLIEVRCDLVQAWKLAPKETPKGQRHGTPAELFPEAAVFGEVGNRFISRDDS